MRPAHIPKRSREALLRSLRRLLVIAGLCAGPALAQTAGTSPQAEPEEPDFAFLAGGPYTQMKNSLQLIHATTYATRGVAAPGGRRHADEFLFFFRTEWGFTDRLELDVITPAGGRRERQNGATLASDYAFADSIVGLRYRLLTEERFPFTLTMGPQLILPTGSVRRGTGAGSAGFAWDVSAAKDWGGPVFLYTSSRYTLLPSADDPTPGASGRHTLHGVEWATAVGLRPLERAVDGSRHDVHIFLEGAGEWTQQVVPGITAGVRRGVLSWTCAPGVRYGFLTSRKTLVEIGVAAPIGLGPNGPKAGIIVQFQFERFFGRTGN